MDINELQERLQGLEENVIQTGTAHYLERLESLQGEHSWVLNAGSCQQTRPYLCIEGWIFSRGKAL